MPPPSFDQVMFELLPQDEFFAQTQHSSPPPDVKNAIHRFHEVPVNKPAQPSQEENSLDSLYPREKVLLILVLGSCLRTLRDL